MKRLSLQKESGKPERKTGKITKIIVVAVLLVLMLEVWMVNRLSTYGNQLAQMKSEESQIELENQVLQDQIAQESSLGSISQKAQSLGFLPTTNYNYLKPVAIASAQ